MQQVATCGKEAKMNAQDSTCSSTTDDDGFPYSLLDELFKDENEPKTLSINREEPPEFLHWSSEDVFNYFSKHECIEVAQALLEQGVDGKELMSMGQMEVLEKFSSLTLGKRLKILFQLRRLKLRTNNLMKIWESNI